MTNKEKAYDEALERAKKYCSTTNSVADTELIELIFPELCELEDEKIRKEIINFLELPHPQFVGKRDHEKWISWLEKQGECHISHDDEIMIKQLTEYFTTGHGLQNTNETVVEWLNDVKEKLEKQDEVVSDKDDIEVEEKGIREAFNKIEDEKQCKQKPQRMISAEAKEAMYNKPADTVEPKCEESKTKIFDAPTPFEDKLYAFVAACEFLAIPSKIEFILEHSQEILDAAKEQIGKEQSSTWSEEDEKEYKYVLKFVDNILNNCGNKKDYEHCKRCYDWLKSIRPQSHWKPSDEQVEAIRLARSFVTDDFNEHPTLSEILMELEEQIKKLRED